MLVGFVERLNVVKIEQIRLRPAAIGDLSWLFHLEQDEEGNRLAGTKPRSWEAFSEHFAQVLNDPRVTARVVLADRAVVGAVSVFEQDEARFIGYRIAREHWGRGIATRAIALLLAEVTARPIRAQVAEHNIASARALIRNGFEVVSRAYSPATDRYTAGEVITFVLC